MSLMCIKECLHTFLLQIHQTNKLKHTGTHKKDKKHDLRVILMENRFLVDPASYYATQRHSLMSDFYKNEGSRRKALRL